MTNRPRANVACLVRNNWRSDHGGSHSNRAVSPFICPVTMLEVALNLPAFVTMTLCLDGTVVRLAKRMFRITNDFSDGFCGFAHNEAWFVEGTRYGDAPEAGLIEPRIRLRSLSTMCEFMVAIFDPAGSDSVQEFHKQFTTFLPCPGQSRTGCRAASIPAYGITQCRP